MDLLSATNVSVSAQNKHIAMPDRDTVKTQSWDTGHDGTWKLETRAKTRHTSVETEPSSRYEKPCLETVSRRDTRLETPSVVGPTLRGRSSPLCSTETARIKPNWASTRPTSDGWRALLTASAFNRPDRNASSPSNTAHCYAELVASSRDRVA